MISIDFTLVFQILNTLILVLFIVGIYKIITNHMRRTKEIRARLDKFDEEINKIKGRDIN